MPYLLALALLALNDGVLKVVSPSALTGKLSDFAGLFFAPVLLLVLVELVPKFRSAESFTVRRLVAYLAIGLVFSLAQVSDLGARVYESVFLPARWITTWRDGFRLTQDPTDLVALSALAASYYWSKSRLDRLAGGECHVSEAH